MDMWWNSSNIKRILKVMYDFRRGLRICVCEIMVTVCYVVNICTYAQHAKTTELFFCICFCLVSLIVFVLVVSTKGKKMGILGKGTYMIFV